MKAKIDKKAREVFDFDFIQMLKEILPAITAKIMAVETKITNLENYIALNNNNKKVSYIA